MARYFLKCGCVENTALLILNYLEKKCLVSVASSPIQFVLTLKCEQIVIKFQKIRYKIRNVVKVRD